MSVLALLQSSDLGKLLPERARELAALAMQERTRSDEPENGHLSREEENVSAISTR